MQQVPATQVMNEFTREYTLSSGTSLLDAVHKQILKRCCEDGQHEVFIYEGTSSQARTC